MLRWWPAVLLALWITLLLCACKPSEPEPADKSGPGTLPRLDVGLVYDAGGRGDKSFNDGAYAGLSRAQKALDLKVKDVEPSAQTSKEALLRRFAQEGTPLILGIGILFTDEITKVAREFPDQKFVCIDYGGSDPPPNLRGIRFREQEGCYLVGAIAALVSKTGKLGFVGGMEIPLIKRFCAGFRAGAEAMRPDVVVLADYAGTTDLAWKNPVKGKELALGQYRQGVDIIFHASGSTGLGVFAAAKESGKDKLAIGVDADQSGEAPDHVLTSMLKRVDEAVFGSIKDFRGGTFAGGVQTLGLADDALDYVYSDQNKRWITPAIRERVEALRKKIVTGEIVVPDK